jgi:hypothetical protein
MSTFRFILEKYIGPKSRSRCPKCGKQREFTHYVDSQTGERLGETVGKCNREVNCLYHYTPAQFFLDHPNSKPDIQQRPTWIKARVNDCEDRIDTMPIELIIQSMANYDRNNLVLFLEAVFGPTMARAMALKYLIGTSRHWAGATVYWQIDISGKVRTGKIMQYDPESGKRMKDPYHKPNWAHRALKMEGFHLRQCFFGEHLMAEFPDKPVGICESEKTAIVASMYFPKLNWVATGGKGGAGWNNPRVCSVLKSRRVILFPDGSAFQDWRLKSEALKKVIDCSVIVSDLLEKRLSEEQKRADWDLADWLLMRRDEKAGWALTDYGYPIFWDK